MTSAVASKVFLARLLSMATYSKANIIATSRQKIDAISNIKRRNAVMCHDFPLRKKIEKLSIDLTVS